VAPGTAIAAVGGADGRVRVYELAAGRLLDTLAWHGRAVNALAWAGTILLAGDGDGALALWDLADLS
jgi:WD40 repeat protein